MQQAINEQIIRKQKIETFIRNYKKDGQSKRTKAYYENRLGRLQKYWEQYEEGHDAVMKLHLAETGENESKCDYIDEDFYGSVQAFYGENYDMIEGRYHTEHLTQIQSEPTQNPESSWQMKPDAFDAGIKLPKISLDKFNGDYEQWPTFHDLFQTLVDQNPSLSNVQKLQYLKLYLIGEPQQLLWHYKVTDLNYQPAWKVLKDRYDNKRVLVHSQLAILLGQSNVIQESAYHIRKIMDTTSKALQALKNLEVDVSNWDPIVVYLLVRKLPHESHQLWEQRVSGTKELSSWEDLRSFLEERFRTLEAMDQGKSANIRDHKPKPTYSSSGPTAKTFYGSIQKLSCKLCSGDHGIRNCQRFLAMSAEKRVEVAKRNMLCWNCLSTNHMSNGCPSTNKCRECNRQHHTLLHLKPRAKPVANSSRSVNNTLIQEANQELNVNSASFIPTVHSCHINKGFINEVLLATAQVRVIGPSGNQAIVRALIDQGSQASFITEKIAQHVNLKRESVNISVQGIGRETSHKVNKKSSFIIQPMKGDQEVEVEGLILSKLTQILPNLRINHHAWSHVIELDLADPQYGEPGPIDLLLGADVLNQILLQGLRKGEPGSPLAQQTIFGWILSGPVHQTGTKSLTIRNFHTTLLEAEIKKFWEIEEFKGAVTLNEDEKRCEELYVSRTTRLKSGRYAVQLPLVEINKENYLGKSRDVAVGRLLQLEHRFMSNPTLRKEYVKCINEYISLGHMKFVPNQELQTSQGYSSFYLPHHAVIKESSSTTKLRVVFDASRASKSGKSLNDITLKGPTVQDDLQAILLRWRKHKIAFTSDIEKMYRQIWVQEPFTELQRIVWRAEPSDPIQDYKLLTVTFGTKSAPFLATRTLRKLALDEMEAFPVASQITLNDFYVDDLLTGADSLEEALEAQRQLLQMMQTGGFSLRKWVSNERQMLADLPSECCEIPLPKFTEQESVVKTLGICWKPNVDEFVYFIHTDTDVKKLTKRTILSQIAKLFDPLGWVAPVIIIAKQFMQKLWLSGLDWDEKVTPELEQEWSNYYTNLPDLKKIKIKRWINYRQRNEGIEIHVFSDASIKAYAAVVYTCVTNVDGKREVNLIMSKTKVAPIKTVSLPRLELCAAALAAKLVGYVLKALQLSESTHTIAWSDSEIVIAWLRQHPNKWTTFVANRVSQIHDILGRNVWRHVPTKENPADCASRGVSPNELRLHDLWWHGPEWLKNSSEHWPSRSHIDTDLESRKVKVNHVKILEPEVETKFSKYTTLIRVVAYCRRFGLNLRQKSAQRETDYLKSSEMREALTILLHRAQERHFAEEIKQLQGDNNIDKRSPILKLNPFLDRKGLLRVGGRLEFSSVPYDQKHQIILPEKDHLTKLIIGSVHKETLHGGVQLMMSVLRTRYWIVNSKNIIRHYVHKCIICFKQKAVTRSQLMGNLPSVRIQPSRPFTYTGVDYCGPFDVKAYKGRTTKTYKSYISLFICMSTKAIHLELVTDLSADGFLAALRRFCSRRGLCQEIFCDNGTNFVGASKTLSRHHKFMMENLNVEIAQLVENEGIKFNFIPPSSPHFGGLWEAGVKSTKFHLKRVLNNKRLTYEELSTILCQIEACLNSRPLCEMTNDPEILSPLTPAHFLIGDNMLAPPYPEVLEVPVNRLDKFQQLQQMVQGFWKRWSSEYLSRLQQRPKWTRKEENVMVDQLVILKDETLPPCKWLMARIIETHPGPDGLIRVVTVKTQSKIVKRPITKICLLPIEN